MMFGNRRHFRELLAGSEEGIASNILAARLKHLMAVGLVTRAPHPDHKQKATYSLTEPAIELLPLIAEMSAWGLRHQPVTPDLAIRARSSGTAAAPSSKPSWPSSATSTSAPQTRPLRPRRAHRRLPRGPRRAGRLTSPPPRATAPRAAEGAPMDDRLIVGLDLPDAAAARALVDDPRRRDRLLQDRPRPPRHRRPRPRPRAQGRRASASSST